MKPGRAVSLVDELRVIENAAEGVALLLDGVEGHTLEVDPEKAAKAVLALVVSRLRQLRLAVRGPLDPEFLLGAHNATEWKAVAGEDPDVRLEPREGRKRP